MSVKLVLDVRENELIKRFKLLKIDYITEQLDLGDIKVLLDDEIVSIIERKTINDLSASIKDGRYKEQKLRLLNTDIDRTKIVYVIEGEFKEGLNLLPYSTLLSSIVGMIVRDNIKVYRTFNLIETADFIRKIMDKASSYKKDKKDNVEVDYLGCVLKQKKKDNLTTDNIFILQLCQIPSITLNMAIGISSKYNNLVNLIKEYNECENKEKMLIGCEYTVNDKVRKIGKNIAEKVYNGLYNNSN